MSLLSLLDMTADVFKPTRELDQFRSERYVWPVNPVATSPCRLQLNDTATNQPMDGTPREWRLFLPPDVDVVRYDRVRIDGSYFDVVSVYPVHSPMLPGVHHLEAVIIAYDGEVPQ